MQAWMIVTVTLAIAGKDVTTQLTTPIKLQSLISSNWGQLPAVSEQDSGAGQRKTSVSLSPVSLLDSLFTATDGFKDEQLKIRTQMRISDLLWKHDQVRSRKHFLQVYEAINGIKQDDQKPVFQQFVSRVQLRSNLLALIGRHDRKWADLLLQESLRRDAAQAMPGITTADQQTFERIKVADAAIQSAPEAASKMLIDAAATMDWKGLPGRVFAVTLNNLRDHDPAAADNVLLQVLASVQGRSSIDFDSLSNVVECMWPIRRDQSDTQGPAIIRQFLAMAQPIVLSRPDGRESFTTRSDNPLPDWRQMLVAFYDEYTPEVAPLIHKKLNFVPPMDGPHSAWWNSGGDAVRLYRDEAKTAVTDRDKDSIYGESARLFAIQGQIEDAFAAARSVGNERFRRQIETVVRQYAVEQAAKRDDARTAYRYAQEEPTQARVEMSTLTIDAALRGKDREFATSMLAEIEGWVGQQADLRGDPRIWLKLGNAGIRIDVEHGFQIMRSAVKVINDADLSVAEGSTKQESQPRVLRVKVDGLQYGVFGLLAHTDLPSAVALAQDIRRKEISVLAQLAICEGLLGGTDASTSEDKQR
jgi:hypothetical protein